METKSIRQETIFSATPAEIYELLMDEAKHAEFTGSSARIDPEIGGQFSVYDNYATGENLELVPSQKIVQSWRASDWPAEHLSQITIILEPVENGTRLIFLHENVPANFHEAIEQGWNDFYWQPLHQYLQEKE